LSHNYLSFGYFNNNWISTKNTSVDSLWQSLSTDVFLFIADYLLEYTIEKIIIVNN
jgi:hypothetical protein